jgi:putative transposase
MLTTLVNRIHRFVNVTVQAIRQRISRWTKPATAALVQGTVLDLARSKPELVTENMLLRQQLIVLNRTGKRPAFTKMDRMFLVLLASKIRSWKDALLIIKPETVLRWHRQGFRLFWKRKSAVSCRQPKVPTETVALIQDMAANNRLWGAERIHGELLKLGIRVSKRTIQKYLRQARPPRPSGQSWATFLHNHARRSGPATLSRSLMCSSDPSSPSLSWNWHPGRWST